MLCDSLISRMNANRRLTRWDRFIGSRLAGLLAFALIVVISVLCYWGSTPYTIEESAVTGDITVKNSDGTIATNVDPKTVRAHHIWIR